ncbi:CoxG family protein [Methylobacterium sp. Gmos1]
MAMTMTGEVVLPADQQTVWEKLNDPEVLKRCIPGCETLEKVGDNELQASAKIAVGPVKATFKGKVTLTDIDPPNGYRITGEGQGGVAGFAKGGAVVRLEPAEGGQTKMTYDVEASVGGKIAQLGGRLINGVAKKYADNFFDTFAKEVQGSGVAGETSAA